jgi:uncharacterized Zn finger protein (UPF0148 family)
MKLQFNPSCDAESGVVGTIICQNCKSTWPAFVDDGEKVICPVCDHEQKNSFFRSKEKKHDQRTREGG